MQTLKFLGNGSGFTESHNNAFFITGKNLVLIDLSMLNLYKLLALEPEKYNKIFLFVTHMHDDHTSGIGLFLQHMFYRQHKTVFIVAPFEIQASLKIEFELKGIDSDAYIFKEPDKIKSLGINALAIKTEHCPELIGQCFGYIFYLKDKKIVYSGDTIEYKKFIEYMKEENSELYLDVSASYGKVHILYDDIKEDLIKFSENRTVFLMHIDDMEKIEKLIEGTKIQIAQTI